MNIKASRNTGFWKLLFVFIALGLLLGASLPAQAQNIRIGVEEVRHNRFSLLITAVPNNAIAVDITVTTGGNLVANWSHGLGIGNPPFRINVGVRGSYYTKELNPATKYRVTLKATNVGQGALASGSITVTTSPKPTPLPPVRYRDLEVTSTSIKLQVVPFPGASMGIYLTPYNSPAYTGCDGSPTRVLSAIASWDFDSLYSAARNRNKKRLWCRLKPDTEHVITLHAYNCVKQNTSKVCKAELVGRSLVTVRTHPRGSRSSFSDTLSVPAQQPTSTPLPPPTSTPTPLQPITVSVILHNSSEVTLSWSPVSGVRRYTLSYISSDMKYKSYNLGAGSTSQRIDGLTPGVIYQALLTAVLPRGAVRVGRTHFTLPVQQSQQPQQKQQSPQEPGNPLPAQQELITAANTAVPPPTNTPVPTNTPMPTATPTNTPVPTNTPLPPPATNTPVPPPTNTPVPPPTNTPVPPQYQVPDSLVDKAEQHFNDNYDPQTKKGGHNWYRVLLAFGASAHPDLPSLQPMTAQDACDRVQKWSGWQPFCDALTSLES